MESDLPQPNTAIAMNSDGDADHVTHPHDSSGLEYHPDSYDTDFSHCAVPATQNPFRSIAEPSVDLPLELDETRDNEESQHDLAIAISTETETDQSSEQREVSLDQTKEVIMSGQREETESERQRRIRSRHPIDYILAPMPELSDAEEVLAALRGARADEDITNKLDEMQKIHYKQRRQNIRMTTRLLREHKQFIKEKNVDKFMKMIDECVKYLRWRDDSPFDEDDYKIFSTFIDSTHRNIWPKEFGDDEGTVFVWRKLVNHILDGDFIVYFKEMWSKVEITIQRLEAEERGEQHVWEKMTEEEKRDIDKFDWVIVVLSNIIEEQETPEIWAKITEHALPYVFKCLESILVQDLVSDSDHPQVELVMSLLNILSNLVEVMQENMPISDRKSILDICSRFHESSAVLGIRFLCIRNKPLCFTLNELKDEQPTQINLKDEDTTLLLVNLNDAVNNGPVDYSGIIFNDYEVMKITLKYLLLKENQIKLLEFRFEDTPEMGLIDVILKGVEKNDKKLQIKSLECLKVIADDEELMECLRSNEKCVPALKGCRKSPHMSVRQKAVDVIMKIMVKKPKDLKVTRKRLERSSCISWSEGDVRNKMNDCGFVVPAETNITGCDGEWLVELLVMRRENNKVYFATIESRFGIKPDESSINFNLCMRKLEKLILTEDFSHEPEPYQSLN